MRRFPAVGNLHDDDHDGNGGDIAGKTKQR